MGNFYFKPSPKPENSFILKHAIANQVNDVSVYQACGDVNTEDLQHFERLMDIVRDKGPLEHWKNLVCTGSTLNKDGFEETLREIIGHFSIDNFKSSHVYVLYTYVVDVVVFKLKNGHQVDVDHLLNVTHASIFDKILDGFLV